MITSTPAFISAMAASRSFGGSNRLRVVGGDAQHGVHVAEPDREDELVAVCGELARDALGVGPLVRVGDGGHRDRAAQVALERLAREVVLMGPAHVADRAEEDEADLHRCGGPRGRAEKRRRQGRGDDELPALLHSDPRLLDSKTNVS
ncbi:MAG: hypothetical protein KGL43_20975 [Burkholderiales bacterium]|nr:hypothetical protein [Burkholderiales bacterium]